MSLEELQKKREELRKKIGEVKEIREKYNDKTKELKKQRYNLAIKIRKFKQEGIHHKEQRDKINIRVANSKDRRKELNKEFKEYKRKADALRKEIIPEVTPLEVLKKRKQDLDFRQMTHQLSKKDEESLVEELKHITKQIRNHQQLLDETPELKEAVEKKTNSNNEIASMLIFFMIYSFLIIEWIDYNNAPENMLLLHFSAYKEAGIKKHARC